MLMLRPFYCMDLTKNLNLQKYSTVFVNISQLTTCLYVFIKVCQRGTRHILSKKGGKDQESIQSSTTPDHMGK